MFVNIFTCSSVSLFLRKINMRVKGGSMQERENNISQKEVKDATRNAVTLHSLHQFTADEAILFQSKLLNWYRQNKRDLLWRRLAGTGDAQQRAYAVLVSEVMLQQTQVVTVKVYYKKWMDRWPTFQHLAEASLEDVNEMWSGLGYYARGRRLYEAARKVVADLGGAIPQSAALLQEQLPGVGRYTAGAVASIAFGERVAAVDGNVIRVLARQRFIGGNSSAQVVLKDIWNIAETVVHPKQPGTFNEAMMELGAVVCTPKTPSCSACPVKDLCLSYKFTKTPNGIDKILAKGHSQTSDIETEPDCRLCLSPTEWDPSLGVKNFPRKSTKSPPRKEDLAVCILHRECNKLHEEEYFLVKRPAKGLLACLWEFPSFPINLTTHSNTWKILQDNLKTHHGIEEENIESSGSIGKVEHLFSHIHQVNVVYEARLSERIAPLTSDRYQDQQWVSEHQFLAVAMSTAMKKIYKIFNSSNSKKNTSRKCTRSFSNVESDTTRKRRKNSIITDFY